VTDEQHPDPKGRGKKARELIASSFDDFYEYYWPRLVHALKAQASNTGWAEDVANEAMMAVLDKRDKLLTCERPDSWLYKVAIRKLRRLESRARDHCCLREDLAAAEDDLRTAAATDIWVEENADLIAAVRALPRRCPVGKARSSFCTISSNARSRRPLRSWGCTKVRSRSTYTAVWRTSGSTTGLPPHRS
jgi:hypothetical protein